MLTKHERSVEPLGSLKFRGLGFRVQGLGPVEMRISVGSQVSLHGERLDKWETCRNYSRRLWDITWK